MTSSIGNGRLQAEDIKRQAAGRWIQILQSVCGLTDSQLNPKVHGPCPKCGGTDRFRALDDVAESGALFCNKCFSKDNGDGLAAIQWLNGCTFPDSLKLASEFLGNHSSQVNGHHKTKPKEPAKPKTVHATAEHAADALAWGMVQSGTIPEQRKPDSAWRYQNADGSDAGTVCRWNLPDGRKEIRQLSCVPDGWITSAMPAPRPLYRLPDIIEAEEVWICEGEKAADSAALLGVTATTSAGGSNAAEKTDWQPLDGKRVYILPDNDEPGEKYAREVVELIRKQAPNATVQVKRLKDIWPEIPDGGDVADWSEQFDTADAETLRDRLHELPDRCGEYVTSNVEASNQEPPVPPPENLVTPFSAGERVRAGDRDNIGTIVSDDGGDTVVVRFEAPSGAMATKRLPRTELRSLDGPVRHLNLDPFSAWDLIGKDTPLDLEVIEGILRIGEVANIIAATKVGKSWFALGLAIAVATGRTWMGLKTLKGNVLLIDNEMRSATLKHRIATVMTAMGIEPSADHARLDVISLRGQFADIESLELELRKYNRDEFVLIILDAKYRAFGPLDENSNTDQTLFHNAVDKIAGDLNSAFMMVHHASKGDQGGKSTTDVGSGGGSQSRAVDSHLIIRPHSDDRYAVLDGAVRSFPPVQSQTLQWQFPLWYLAASVEPNLKAVKTPGDSRLESKDRQALGEIAEIIRQDLGKPKTAYDLRNKFGCGADRINRLIRVGLNHGTFVVTGTKIGHKGVVADLITLPDYADQYSTNSRTSEMNV
ncbi:MAG: AAA family ATPase [Planctomycetota bacterium]|nr:AAA family ATPase [Planctomycetota bacterium]